MPFWHVTTSGTVAHLVHSQATEEEPEVGSWPVQLWRGAPSWDSHPELEHAMLGIMLPSAHADFIRHRWTFDIPDRYDGKWNCGDDRQWMTLKATGGSMNWTLALLFPRRTPQFVYAAVAAGFHASLIDDDIQTGAARSTARLAVAESGGEATLGSEAGAVLPADGESSDPLPGSGAAADDANAAGPSGPAHTPKSPGRRDDPGLLPVGIHFTPGRIATEPLVEVVVARPPVIDDPSVSIPASGAFKAAFGRLSLAQRLALTQEIVP